MFASAKVVLGYHGAGFINMVYSKNHVVVNTTPTVTAIELFATRCPYEGFFTKRLAKWGFRWVELAAGDAHEAEPFRCNWINKVTYNETDLDRIVDAVDKAFVS